VTSNGDEQVMLESDLAFILQVDTKRINEQVKRNISRFPKEFCFQLSNTEWNAMKSQFATSFLKPGGKVKSPWVLTELVSISCTHVTYVIIHSTNRSTVLGLL